MSFIWLLCKVCLAIEGYNIIVDYIVTKTLLNYIKKDYDFSIKPKYRIKDNLSFIILLDTISIYTKLKYYHEFKSILIEELLNEDIISIKTKRQDNNINHNKEINTNNIEKIIKEKVNNNNIEKNIYNKNKPKMLIKKKEDRKK